MATLAAARQDSRARKPLSFEEARKIQQASQQAGYLIATADGVNYPDALNMMTATLPRLMNMSQVKQVVISERFASDSDAFRKLMERLVYDNEFIMPRKWSYAKAKPKLFYASNA